MKLPRKYASGAAFRVALEDRLKRIAREESLDLQRVRRQAAFDRLLCRLPEPDPISQEPDIPSPDDVTEDLASSLTE